MTIEAKTPSTPVTDVARLMAIDSSCPHSVWFLSRYSSSLGTGANGYDPIDRDPRRTSLIRKTATDLEEQGHEVHPSLRNHFEARGSRSGARLTGQARPDRPSAPTGPSRCTTSGKGSPVKPTSCGSGSTCTFCPGLTTASGAVPDAGRLRALRRRHWRDGSRPTRSTRSSLSGSRQ